jgi:hypothetical protein
MNFFKCIFATIYRIVVVNLIELENSLIDEFFVNDELVAFAITICKGLLKKKKKKKKKNYIFFK